MTDDVPASKPPLKKGRRSLKNVVDKVANASPKEDEVDRGADNALQNEQVNTMQSTRQLREDYADKVFWFLVSYCVGALILVLLHGFAIFGFKLESQVLSIIVGSTAVSAIGLVGFVAKGLFK